MAMRAVHIERLVWAPPEATFEALSRVGRGGRYPGTALDRALWGGRTLAAPLLVAGGRRDDGGARSKATGEAVDHWTVSRFEPGQAFGLACRMRGIGTARIDWTIEPRPGGRSLLVQRAGVEPDGAIGSAYWTITGPPHRIVFARLADGIARDAERHGPGAPPTRPRSGLRVLRREIVVPRGLDETFAFFADAANLEAITPDWLHFQILTPLPIAMQVGAAISYRIRIHGLPVRWDTRIDAWEPGVRFVDRQVRGPYRWWHHEHRFEAVDGGTRVVDEVEWTAPMRWLSEPILVRRDLRRIFDERTERLATTLGGASPVTRRFPTLTG